MNNNITIKITDLIGNTLCISADDGQKVYDKIAELMKNGKSVTISFENATTLISLFLNVSIGQLYGTFSEEDIRSKVKVEGLSQDDLELLGRVVENAKKYYKNPKGYDHAWLEGEENEE